MPHNPSTSLLRIDEDGPAHRYDRPLIRVDEPEKTLLPPVENKKRQSMRRSREEGKKGDCVVQ